MGPAGATLRVAVARMTQGHLSRAGDMDIVYEDEIIPNFGTAIAVVQHGDTLRAGLDTIIARMREDEYSNLPRGRLTIEGSDTRDTATGDNS